MIDRRSLIIQRQKVEVSFPKKTLNILLTVVDLASYHPSFQVVSFPKFYYCLSFCWLEEEEVPAPSTVSAAVVIVDPEGRVLARRMVLLK